MNPDGVTIIVVEDEPDIRKTLCSILTEDSGHKVIGLERGTDALQLVRKSPFDIIVADIKLPDISGMEILELAKEINPDAAVIMMTGYASVETAVDAVNQGAYAYFVKPVNPDEMKTTITNALKHQKLSQENRRLVNDLQQSNMQLLEANEELRSEITERKRAEATLRESEEKFAKTFRANPHPVFITRLDDGKLIEVNNGFTHFTGYSQEESIGHTTDELGISATTGGRGVIIQKLKEENRISNEERLYRTKSGELHTGLLSAEVIPINGEKCAIAIITDITERKQAEEALSESEEKFARVFRSSPNILSISTLEDGTYIDVNDSLCRVTGYSREEMIGHPAIDFGVWTKPEERAKVMQTLEKEGRVSDVEMQCRKKSGEMHTVLSSSELIHIGGEPCVITVGIDITERKKAEEALKESEEKFAKTFRASPDAISIVTVDDGRIIDVNEGFTRFSGYSPEEAIGKTVVELGLWAKPGEQDRMLSLLKKHDRFSNEEFSTRMKSGEVRIGLFSTEILSIGGRQCRMSVIKDITERKQAEATLRESEEKFAGAFRASPDAISIVTVDDGRIIDVNEGFTRFTGYSPEEAIGKTPVELGLWVKSKEHDRMLGLLKKNVRFSSEEFSSRTKSGEVRIGLFSTEILSIDGRQCRISVIKDITDRKQAEEQYQTIIGTALDGFWLSSLEGKFLEVNDAYCNMMGYAQEELLEMSIPDIEAVENPEDTARHIKTIIEQGSDRFESRHRRKDGRIIDVEISVNYLNVEEGRLVVFIRDVTERRQVEELYRTLANSSPIGVYIVQDGKFKFVNPQFQKDTGFTEDELLHMDSLRLVHPKDRGKVKENAVEMLKGGRSSPYEFRAIGKDGKTIWAIETATSIYYQGKRAVLGNFMDITERKQMEHELQGKKEQLDAQNEELTAQQQELLEKTREVEEANRLKSEFLANMSHDLRTPLNAIIGFSELMIDEAPGKINEQQRQCLDDVLSSGQHLLTLINEVLDLSKIESGKTELRLTDIALAEVIDSLAKTMTPIITPRKQSLDIEVEKGLPPVNADEAKLKRVLLNLMDNSSKFTPEGGKLKVEAIRKDDWCQISVIDNGMGIKKEDQKRVFEPFAQLDSPVTMGKSGTGLGLALVKQIVKKHGGRIWIESKYGKGSRFSFTLPLTTTGQPSTKERDRQWQRRY